MSPELQAEIYRTLERLDAPPELLAIIGSIGDTLTEDEALALLQQWNETGAVAAPSN